jgi:hypothetical protein
MKPDARQARRKCKFGKPHKRCCWTCSYIYKKDNVCWEEREQSCTYCRDDMSYQSCWRPIRKTKKRRVFETTNR